LRSREGIGFQPSCKGKELFSLPNGLIEKNGG